MRETTSISCVGDAEFVESLRLLAKKRRTKVGILVREAIDRAHGDALKTVSEQAAIFFADDCASTHNIVHGSEANGEA